MPSRAWAVFLTAVVSVIQPATSTGSPPASSVSRYRLILVSASTMVWREPVDFAGGVVCSERGVTLSAPPGAGRLWLRRRDRRRPLPRPDHHRGTGRREH